MIMHSGYLLGVVKLFAPSNHLVGRNHGNFFYYHFLSSIGFSMLNCTVFSII